MARKREIPEDTAAGELATFLVGLVRQATLRELAEEFGKSSSTWGNYLNGAQLIPKELLSRLLEAYTVPGQDRRVKERLASALWIAAARERRSNPGGRLVRQHQRREDALHQVVKYQELAANAERHLAELRPMLAYTQGRLENVQLQLKQAGEREKARIELQLSQARERLSRVQLQQERARSRRLMAEEQQEFWMREALAAQDEINRLEREAQDLAVPEGTMAVSRPEPAEDTDSDTEIDIRLEHIEAEGLEDEARIKLDLDADDVETTSAPGQQPCDDSGTPMDTRPAAENASALVVDQRPEPSDGQADVQLLSKGSLDSPSASASTRPASVATRSSEARGRSEASLGAVVLALGLAQTSQDVAVMFSLLCERERGHVRFLEMRLIYRAFGITATRAQRAAVTSLMHGYLPAAWGDLQRLLEVLKATPEEIIAFHQAYERVPRTPPHDHASSPTPREPLGVVRMPEPVQYLVVLAALYTIAAGLMAGIRADPGPAIWKLAVYAVGGGLVALVLWFFATGSALYVAGIHGRGMFAAIVRPLYVAALLLGLVVSGAGVDIPGRWIADAVGLL
ncbi:hypothetical protein AB0953_29820 [Streptomyces sp. NPDC046866]|uniref:helix-turn-helix domain-containing protein n=1 Tax=Streptomyces sp. NPDC046866 TaxID=3154921 RepID=UPI003452FC38